VFWENSALGAILLSEPESAAFVSAFDGDEEPAIWWGTPAEAHSMLARGLREKRFTREEATSAAERLRALRRLSYEVPPSEDVRTRAMRLLSAHRLRAADALQLAAALFWCEEQPSNETFACLDTRLREAARSEGFTLFPAQ
jgi:uncharacterized protein